MIEFIGKQFMVSEFIEASSMQGRLWEVRS